MAGGAATTLGLGAGSLILLGLFIAREGRREDTAHPPADLPLPERHGRETSSRS